MDDLVNNTRPGGWDILAIQEPPISHYEFTTGITNFWHTIYPVSKTNPLRRGSRSLLLVSRRLSTNSWKQIQFDHPDVTAVEINTSAGTTVIINIYNDCEHSRTLIPVDEYLHSLPASTHIIMLGDFNRHHPLWDEAKNSHLFTEERLAAAQVLLDLVADHDLVMSLPPGIPTHEHSSTKVISRLDNVFASQSVHDRLISCNAILDQRIVCTDHFSITSIFDMSYEVAPTVLRKNFKEVDWEAFDRDLATKLSNLETHPILDIPDFDRRLTSLSDAIQSTIETNVPLAKVSPYTKRWWSKELTVLRERRNNLYNRSSRHRDSAEDPVHREYAEANGLYRHAIKQAKDTCWIKFIDEADGESLWTAHKFLKGGPSDGGATRIPTLSQKRKDGTTRLHSSNTEKSQILYECFFPSPQLTPTRRAKYPEEVTTFRNISADDIERVISNLKPDKSPGPDGIPNSVFIQCRSTLTPILVLLFRATFDLEYYPDAWKTSTTVVLRKPDRPDYTIAKAYRPIALLNVISKTLSACVASELNRIAETFDLLPKHHFGGRAGRTTTDSMHLLTSFIKDAWRAKQVVSALFLDVTGAFPNASPARLVHNMRKMGFPEQYAAWTERKLRGRQTALKFDDFVSDAFEIKHGIDQGCPLSCIYYIIYNSGLIETVSEVKAEGELAVGYIDDVALLARAETFEESNEKLKRIMEKKGGALDWARTHTSEFALEKTALLGFNRYSSKCGEMKSTSIGGIVIEPVKSHKFLGVLFDTKLTWREQRAKVLKVATNWSLLIRRVSKVNHGLKPTAARKLYSSVFLPKISYAADVWWTPTLEASNGKRKNGSVGFTQRLQSAQRTIAIAISGALRTSPTQALLSHAGIPPIELELRKTTHRAAVRLAGIPEEHPLYPHVKRATSRHIVHHKSTIQTLFETSNVDKSKFAAQPRFPHLPKSINLLNLRIAENKEAAIGEERTMDPSVKIFTDGSMVDGKVGAAAVLIRRGRPDKIARLHLGSDKEHEVYEAEVVGLLLGMEILARERDVWSAAIYIDNQAVLKTLISREATNVGHLFVHLDKAIKKARKNTRGARMDTRWIPGHMDVEGNEKADYAAKEAAREQNITNDFIPRYLRGQIPTNPTSAKRTRKAELPEEWRTWVGDTERVQEWRNTDGTFPSTRFSELASNLPREHYAMLTQLRTGHFPFADYLHRFKLIESRRCRLCNSTSETILHVTMGCPALTHLRAVRDQALGAASRSLKALLQPGPGTLHLMNYIRGARSQIGALASRMAEDGGV